MFYTTTSYTNSVKQCKIRAISPFKVIQGHRYLYQSKAHIRLLIKTIAMGNYCALSLEFMNLLGIYTVDVARSLCRRLLQNIVIVNCPLLWLCQPLLCNAPQKLPNSVKQRKIRAILPFHVIQGHRFWYQPKSHIDFLSVINTNLPAILHRLRDIAFEVSKIAIFGYRSCV